MTVVLPASVNKARKRIRVLAPVKPARADALNYFNQINGLNAGLLDVSDHVTQLIEQGADASRVARLLESSHREQIQRYLGMASSVSSFFVDGLNSSNKRKVEHTVASAFGLNSTRTMNAKDDRSAIEKMGVGTRVQAFPIASVNILDDPVINGIVQASAFESTQLIVSIAPNYFKLVAQAVAASFRGEDQVGGGSLAERLQEIGGITEWRSQFIARDQTAKLTSSLTRARHEAVGINKYKWKNSQDRRVVGNPSGLYPRGNAGHGDHWGRENKVFSYAKPPRDGNPGMAYNCRCTAQAVLDLDDIDAVFV